MDAAQIAALIPHGAAMSLLDGVQSWDEKIIECFSSSHLRSTNPLLVEGCLPACMLVEYAAQAAAVHAGLMQTGMGEVRAAYVGAIKSVKFYAEHAPEDEVLTINATAELQSAAGAIYYFMVKSSSRPLAEGRLILVQP